MRDEIQGRVGVVEAGTYRPFCTTHTPTGTFQSTSQAFQVQVVPYLQPLARGGRLKLVMGENKKVPAVQEPPRLWTDYRPVGARRADAKGSGNAEMGQTGLDDRSRRWLTRWKKP